jgi:hypothetical protein
MSLEPLSWTLRALCDFANSRRLYDGSMSLLYSSDVIGLLFLTVPQLQSASDSYSADFRLYARQSLDYLLTTKMWHTSDPRDSVFVLQSFHPAFKGMRANYSATVEYSPRQCYDYSSRRGLGHTRAGLEHRSHHTCHLGCSTFRLMSFILAVCTALT